MYTTYVSDVAGNVLAIYQHETATMTLQAVEVPIYGSGRFAVYKPASQTYFYEISDHLGNVRAVIGMPAAEVFSADFEIATNVDFENYSRNDDDLMNNTPAGTYSQLLNGGYAGRIGVAKSVAVSPGDVIKVEAYGKYRDLTSDDENLDGFAAALTSAFGLSSGLPGDPGMAFDALDSYGALIEGGFNHHEDPDAPKAYLNILLFDKNHNFVDGAYRQLDDDFEQVGITTKAPHDYLVREVTITEAGYAYIFFSNENLTQVDVHFDDVKITHTHSNIVAGADYYPFGLAMDGQEIDDEPYRWGYQGQFSEKDLTTGMQAFELRMYDPRIGRWLGPDPYGQFHSPYLAMGNNPLINVDPDGGTTGPGIPIIAPFKYAAAIEAIQGNIVLFNELMAGARLLTEVVFAPSTWTSFLEDASWLAKDIADFATSDRIVNEAKKGFLGATHLAGGLTEGYSGVSFVEPDPFATKVGQGMAVLTSVYTMTPTPGGSPVFATPNGNVPITQPVPVAPSAQVERIHNLNANGERGQGANKADRKQVDDAAREAGIKDRRGFGKFIEKIKGKEGRGGADNFTYEELLDLAEDFKAQGGY